MRRRGEVGDGIERLRYSRATTMIDRLEALAALHATGTTGHAAVGLRITQSAVSKRIAALEAELGMKLVERRGRHARLTPDGVRLLNDAQPLLFRLREVLQARAQPTREVVSLAATDSLLASWLPELLRRCLERKPGLHVELHAHRGPALLERVRSGRYVAGICPAWRGDRDLVSHELAREPMVIVPARLGTLPQLDPLPVWTIEEKSTTWEAIGASVKRTRRTAGYALEVQGRLESFTALVQVARAGFAHTLVPLGVATQLGVAEHSVAVPGLVRPIALVARKSAFHGAGVQSLVRELDVLKVTLFR